MLPSSFTSDFLRQLELLSIQARRAYLGSRQGGHISLKRGHGIEFSDYRKYELGDDPRHIDWGVFARNERLYVKQFQEEQDLSALVMLDGSGSMRFPENDNKWEMGRDVALAISYILFMQQDRVMVSVPGYMNSPFLSGGQAMHRLNSLFENIDSTEERDFLEFARRDMMRIRFPGIAIVISDLLMPFAELKGIFDRLRSRNLDITVVQILGENDRELFPDREFMMAVDSETGEEIELMLDSSVRKEYQKRFKEHQETLDAYFKTARIPHVIADPAQGIAHFVFTDLVATGLLR